VGAKGHKGNVLKKKNIKTLKAALPEEIISRTNSKTFGFSTKINYKLAGPPKK
jgi:hypothetical protein